MQYNDIMKAIAELAQAEKVTKETLGMLSRELLLYTIDTADVRPVNALLGTTAEEFTLTAINWRVACQFFHFFLPFTSNYDEVKDSITKGGKREPFMFNKKSPKKWDKCSLAIYSFLDDEASNIWTWQNENIKIEAKAVDYSAKIAKDVSAAMEKGGLDLADVMLAVLQGSDTSIEDLIAAIGNIEEQVEEVEEQQVD